MRINQPITNKLKDYSPSQKIVSTTDVKGVITDVNHDFIDISGFSRDELIGEAHNLVRHPSMPQAAFAELWRHNKMKKPWMGMVKNRCKNGDHYWVDAFVAPIYQTGQITGYQSVRQKPNKELIKRAEQAYQSSLNPASQFTQTMQALPLSMKLFVGFSIVSLAALMLWVANAPILLTAVVMAVGNAALSYILAKPWMDFARRSKSIFNSTLACKIYTGRSDELGQLELIMKFMQSQQDTILHRSADVSAQVNDRAYTAQTESANTTAEVESLYNEVEMASTATQEMSVTVQEVAEHAALTSTSADESKQNVDKGKSILQSAKTAIDDLVTAVNKSSDIIQHLSEDSSQIGSVVDVISSIAEQTNLLALNAAIEAARAGEQGRGFAVVADEVRALAAKTQESTGQISEMISKLQNGASGAVTSINASHEQVNVSVENIHNLEEQFSTILENVNKISEMCVHIATATEQQSEVAEEINKNITNINSIGQNTIDATQKVNNNNEQLREVADAMNSMIVQFQDLSVSTKEEYRKH